MHVASDRTASMSKLSGILRYNRRGFNADEGTAAQLLRVVLVSDIEGFTALTGELGDAVAAELLAGHDSIIDSALEENGGRLEGRTGDGVVATFDSVISAVNGAVTIQRQLANFNNRNPQGSLHVRVGLAAGEPLHVDGALFGCVVQLAARLCQTATPGKILVSNAVRELSIGKADRFGSPQMVELKGFRDPVQAWEVQWRADKAPEARAHTGRPEPTLRGS